MAKMRTIAQTKIWLVCLLEDCHMIEAGR